MADEKLSDVGPLEFPSTVDVNDDVPSDEAIAKIADYPVFDVDGIEISFRHLWEGADGEKRTHTVLVIFIRHFYCGVSYMSPTFLFLPCSG
jgi:hypothetical protein